MPGYKSIYEEIVEELERNGGTLGEDFEPAAAKVQLSFFDSEEEAEEFRRAKEAARAEAEAEGGEDLFPQDDFAPSWAPGAQDGVALYHFAMAEPSNEDMDTIQRAVEALATGATANFEAEVLALEAPVIGVVGDIQEYVVENADRFDPANMIIYSMDVMTSSTSLAAIKFALTVTALIDLSGEANVVEIIRNLSKYEEFTVFCIYNFLAWESGNTEKEILEAAKDTSGWGRIHAISALNAIREEAKLSDETKDWVFRNGGYNEVMPSYIAEPSFMISECEKKIDEPLDAEEMGLLADIASGLFEEPQYGIEFIEVGAKDRETMVKKLLKKAERFLESEGESEGPGAGKLSGAEEPEGVEALAGAGKLSGVEAMDAAGKEIRESSENTYNTPAAKVLKMVRSIRAYYSDEEMDDLMEVDEECIVTEYPEGFEWDEEDENSDESGDFDGFEDFGEFSAAFEGINGALIEEEYKERTIPEEVRNEIVELCDRILE